MSSEEISLVSSQNGLSSHLLVNVFQDEALRFGCGSPPPHHQQQQRRLGGDPAKTRELAAYNIDEKLFGSATTSSSFPAHHPPHDFPRNFYHRAADHSKDPHGTSGDESDPDEDEEDDEDDDDVDDDGRDGGGACHHHHAEQLIAAVDNHNNNNKSSKNPNTTSTSNTNNASDSGNLDKLGNGKSRHHSSFGSGGEVMAIKDGGGGAREQAVNSTVTLAKRDGEMY